jgi:tRNA A37 methylthiotransferase MiaB
LTVLKRWKHFFRDKDNVVNEILEFENAWWKEVVLTWVNLWAWWSKNTNNIKDSRLAELLEYILKKTNIPRIKISSLWPEFVSDECLEIFKNKRILPHFHYSVQSGSSKILKSMKRHYDWEYIKNLLEKTKNLRRKDGVEVSIWADLLVGFPWENEEDFMETYHLVERWLITKCHIFPFSSHKIWETIPASKLPNQISEKIKKERVKKLEKIWNKIREEFIKRNQKCHSTECQNQQNIKNSSLEVLIEVVKNEKWKLKWKGWTQNYIEANEDNFEILSWEIKRNSIIRWVLNKT